MYSLTHVTLKFFDDRLRFPHISLKRLFFVGGNDIYMNWWRDAGIKRPESNANRPTRTAQK
jgi:hypothetical protein